MELRPLTRAELLSIIELHDLNPAQLSLSRLSTSQLITSSRLQLKRRCCRDAGNTRSFHVVTSPSEGFHLRAVGRWIQCAQLPRRIRPRTAVPYRWRRPHRGMQLVTDIESGHERGGARVRFESTAVYGKPNAYTTFPPTTETYCLPPT